MFSIIYIYVFVFVDTMFMVLWSFVFNGKYTISKQEKNKFTKQQANARPTDKRFVPCVHC